MNLVRRSRDFDPKYGPLGQAVAERSYLKQKELCMYHGGESGKETWEELAYRVATGNIAFNSKGVDEIEYQKLYDKICDMKILLGGRHFSNTGMLGRQHIGNCYTAGWDWNRPAKHFAFTFDRLMEGGGVGSNVSDKYFSNTPCFKRVKVGFLCNAKHQDYKDVQKYIEHRQSYSVLSKKKTKLFKVPDSKEGWTEALNTLMLSIMTGYPNTIYFDVSDVRPKGALMKKAGGTASGPEALLSVMSKIYQHSQRKVGQWFDWEDAMYFDHWIAECVMCGGVRRSARMSMKHWKDKDIIKFINCKSGKDGDHWTTNISVIVDDEYFESCSDHKRLVEDSIISGMRKNGEPGIISLNRCQDGEQDFYSTNPCGEITMGEFEFCNLGHINLGRHSAYSFNEVAESARLVTRALIRANFSDLPHETKYITERLNRIGVGFLGLQDFAAELGIKYTDIHSNTTIQKYLVDLYDVVRAEADSYSKALGLPAPIKVTTIAPTGSIGLVAGETAGCQAIVYKYYKRWVKFHIDDPELKSYASKGYEVAVDPYGSNHMRVAFPTKDALVERYDDELIQDQSNMTIGDQFKLQSMLQECWADNSISFTASYATKDVSIEDFKNIINKYGRKLKGTTVYPNDTNFYAAPPYEPLTKDEYEAKVKEIEDFQELAMSMEHKCINGVCEMVV